MTFLHDVVNSNTTGDITLPSLGDEIMKKLTAFNDSLYSCFEQTREFSFFSLTLFVAFQ